MKCSSCGRNFDEKKYYRICPKCGTYNNIRREEFQFDRQDMPGQKKPYGCGEAQPQEEPYMRQENTQDVFGAQPQKKSGGLKGLAIALAVLAVVGAVEFMVSVVMVMGDGLVSAGSKGKLSDYLLDGEMEETVVSVGESFALEENTGISLQIDGVEVVCGADTFADFPKGQKLIGVKLSCPGADISFDAVEESPLGMVYVGYHQTFKEVLEGDSFKGYRSVVGDREDFSLWDVRYGEEESGYVYVFLPADVTEGTIYLEKQDPSDGRLLGINAVNFVLEEVQ